MAQAPACSGRGDDWVAAAALGSACTGPRAAVSGKEEEGGGEEELEHTWPAWAEAPSSPHFDAAKDALVSLIPARECALASGQMLVARILGKEGIEASVELVEAILAAKRHMTAREARDFPHKFSCVRVADLAHGNLQDEDLLEVCCGVFPRLKILKLHGNRLRSLPNLYTLGSHLRMLDLSANGLERLPHNESVWAHFRCLGVLFLHDNQITEPQSLLALVSCHALRHLTLRGNPLAQRERYRGLVLERVPQLSAIDAFVVADMEQHVCEACSPGLLRAKGSPFASHACGDQLSFTFALPRTFAGGLSYAGAYAMSQAITGRSTSTLESAKDRLLWELDTHLYALTRVRRKSSPATSIQCVLRGWLCRRAERRRCGRESGAARRIQALWRGWELRDRLERDAESLLLDLAPDLLIRHDGTRVERHGVAARRRRQGGSEIEDEKARAEAARRRRLFKGVGSVEQQAAVAIQRVWMKRDVRAHRAASATVLASFFSSVQTYRRGATETLRRRGFSGQDVAFLACHRDIDPEAFEAVLKFSCAYALRVADANIDTGASDTTLAECFLGKSALEVQRGDLKESFSYLSGKRRLETSLQSMHARCASMQAMCARWGDAEAWNAKRNRFWRDIRRLEASMAVMQDRLTALLSNPRSLAHTCWSRDARFAKVSRRVAGIRRPPRLDAMLASMQAQRHEDARADVVETQLSRSPLYVLYGPLAQPSVLAWAMHALRALLRREKVARRLKIISGPLLAAKKSRTQGALVEVYPGEKVLREAGVRLAQSVWRAYAARKAHNVQARALLQRGATCIQRAWRSAPFRARMAFVESLAQYLQRLDVMTYRKAYYLLPGDATNGSLDWAKNGADSDDADKEDADKESSFRIGQAQEVPTEEANQSPCLFIEESVLRVIRRLKGRKLLRNPSTLMAAQESSLGSECTFSYANHLRLLSARSSPTTLGREVRDSAPEAIASSDGENADFWIRPPPWHRAFLRHGAAHAREGFVEDTLLEQCEGNRPGLLRVGIPDWMHVSPGLLEATQRNAQTSNADLCRIITRGAILTSGELVVPRDGAAGTGKYFEKISMAQRLADSTSTEEPASESVEDSQTLTSVVKTGIVLVRLKFQSHAEARARAAMCFARTWQARTRESLFVVAEHMLGDAYGKTRQNQTRVAWGGIPSTYTSIIKRVISQHDRIEENARRARAVQTSSEYAHRASTLQGRRKRRFGRQTGNDDGGEQEEDAVEAWKEEDDGNDDDTVPNDEGEDEVAAQLAEQLAALDAFNSTFSIRKGSVRKPQSVLRARKRHPRRTKPAQLAEHGQFLASLDTLPLLAPTGERVGVVASAKGTGRAPINDAGQDVDGLWPKSSPTSQSQSAEDHHHHHHLEDISRAAEMVRIEGLWLDSHLRAADEAKHKRLVRHVKQLREKERARQGVKQARISQHAVHLDRNHIGEPSRPRCTEAPVRIPPRNEDNELGQKVRRGRFLVDRVPRVVTETSDRAFRTKERMMYDEELARMTKRREQVQRERARRNAHREEREESLFQSQATLSVTKQESRRKARAVICARWEKMQKRVAQVREEDERRRERILHARQTSVQMRQEDSKMGRLFLRMRQTRANAVRQAEERKLRMRVQHEEGLRSIVRALQGQSRPRPPVC